MKVFKVYFLALLLIFMVPVLAEDTAEETEGTEEAVSEEAAQGTEEVKKEEAEKKEEAKEEAEKEAEKKPEEAAKAPVEETVKAPAEEVKAEEQKPAEPAPMVEVKADEPKVTAKVESEGEGEADKKDDKEKSEKRFNVSVSNGFSHGLSKERKSFGYGLNLGASYTFPFKMTFAAEVGLKALYRYDMERAVPNEDGTASTEEVVYGKFDGTPLSLGLSMPFKLFWEIGGSAGISVALPFTSTELWDQYNIYTMLSVNLGLKRSFKIAKETSLSAGFGFEYTKTFADEDYAWDDYSNEPLDLINEHAFSLGLNLSLAYKGATLSVGGGYGIGRNYSVSSLTYNDGEKSDTVLQEWSYAFSFSASLGYSYKDWNFGLGVRTNAPEYDSGNYSGFTTTAGDPAVDNGSANYPFKPKYTMVFANIGYSYSF